MKRVISGTAVVLAVLFAGALPARSQTQNIEGYTAVGVQTGSAVCLGRWIPPAEVGRPGVCEGQLVDVTQLTAISTKLTADRLDQLLAVLGSIDQKLADANDRIERLLKATADTQASIDRQVGQVGDLLRDAMTRRFDALTRTVLANEAFRKELDKLKEDILIEVEKYYQTPSAK